MSTENGTTTSIDVQSIVTNKIIDLLENALVPWKQPWAYGELPTNLLSKRPYRGINVWLLGLLNSNRNLFLTFDQLKSINGSVKRGEHGHMVAFWTTEKKSEELDSTEQPTQKKRSQLRYYKVFNIDQCKDIPAELIPPIPQQELEPLFECESIVRGMPHCPIFTHKKQKASYDLVKDIVNLPQLKSFDSQESYYASVFYHLILSTGHEKRLNRRAMTDDATETFIAELGSCYLCNFAGIRKLDIPSTGATIEAWLQELRSDKRFIISVANQAQKAVDYILNLKEVEVSNEIEQSEVLA